MLIRVLVCAAACVLGLGCASEGGHRSSSSVPEAQRAAVNGYLNAVSDASKLLGSVTDTASARAAMPQLEQLIKSIDASFKQLGWAGSSDRDRVSGAYGEQLRAANEAFAAQVNRIKGTAGLGSVLGPLLDKIQLFRG